MVETAANNSADAYTTHLAPHPQIASRIIDGEALVVIIDSGEVVMLNEVGSRVWAMIDSNRSLGAIIDGIVAEFNTTREEAETDVRAFVEQMVEDQILVISSVPEGEE